MLKVFAAKNGFVEVIRQPTRDPYLLDMFLTDFVGAYDTAVLPSISNHMCTQMSISISVDQVKSKQREVWNFGAADWKMMVQKLTLADWRILDTMDVNDAVLWFNTRIVAIMSIAIPKITFSYRQSSHAWINKHCLDLVRAKNAAEGTEFYREACKRCSDGMYDQFLMYVQDTHAKLGKSKQGPRSGGDYRTRYCKNQTLLRKFLLY